MVRLVQDIAPALLLAALAAGVFAANPHTASAVTLNLEITATADDDTWYPQFPAWDSDVGPSCTLCQGFDGETIYLMALRFLNVTIPQGASITSATLQLADNTTAGGDGAFGVLYGNDTDDAPAWGGATTPESMTKTTTSAVMSNADVSGGVHTVDVTDIVQEIIDRAGWVSGNDLAFGGDETGAGDAMAYLDYPTVASALSIEYTEGGGEEEEAPARVIRLQGNVRLQGVRLF